MFSVTPCYALPIAVVYLILWFRVTARRSASDISIGSEADQELLLRVRQHGNCAEWSGFVLLLMILAEGMNAPDLYLHISGGLLLLGRIAHPFGLRAEQIAHALRYVGNGSNILAALNTMICLAVNLTSL